MDENNLKREQFKESLLRIADEMADLLDGREKINAKLLMQTLKISVLCERITPEAVEMLTEQQAKDSLDYFTLVLQGMEQFLKENGMEV